MKTPIPHNLVSRQEKARQGPNLNVLVVDPQPESRSLLKTALRSLENVDVVRETSTPVNVLEMLSEAPAHVILIEQALGEANVFELVKQFHGHPNGANSRFVLMSNKLDTESRKNGMEAGILGYLSKPFDIRSLEAAIRDSMGQVSTNHRDTLNRLRRISFFSDFSDLELVRLLKICHTRKFGDGETLFREGEPGNRLYVLLAGKVDIVKRRDEGVEVLTSIQPGNCFGEMAIVDAEPRSADARASGDLMVIEVHAQILNDINDILALKIFRKIAILVTQKLRSYTN